MACVPRWTQVRWRTPSRAQRHLVTKVAPTIVDDNERMPTKWTKVPPPLRRAIAEAPQSWAAVAAARRATRGDLRILAFHGVPDFKRFADLLDAVTAQYVPVSASQVERALGGEELLPPYPVWFTFDDGLPSTFAAGELLARHGVRATAFVCPGVLDTDRLLWFQVRQRCLELYLLTDEDPRFALSRLKSLNDAERRAETDVLQLRLVAAGATSPRQADQRMLETWIAQGHDIGNHTWDHPMLDQCSPEDPARPGVPSASRTRIQGDLTALPGLPQWEWVIGRGRRCRRTRVWRFGPVQPQVDTAGCRSEPPLSPEDGRHRWATQGSQYSVGRPSRGRASASRALDLSVTGVVRAGSTVPRRVTVVEW